MISRNFPFNFAEITCEEDDDEEDENENDFEDVVVKPELDNEGVLDDNLNDYQDDFYSNDAHEEDIFEAIDYNYETTEMKKEAKLKLHKLDHFLLNKLLTTDKGFLRTRFLSSIISKQNFAENARIATKQPVAMKDGSFMCHLCEKVGTLQNFYSISLKKRNVFC